MKKEHSEITKDDLQSTSLLGRVIDKMFPPEVFGDIPFDLSREGVKILNKAIAAKESENKEEYLELLDRLKTWQAKISFWRKTTHQSSAKER